jgi:hypothetical protein
MNLGRLLTGIGYTWFDNLYGGGPGSDASAQAALGRFGIAREFGEVKSVHLGAEIAIQNGDIARLSIPQDTIDAVGGILSQVCNIQRSVSNSL